MLFVFDRYHGVEFADCHRRYDNLGCADLHKHDACDHFDFNDDGLDD